MPFSVYKNNIKTVGGSGANPLEVTGSAAQAINQNFINIGDNFDRVFSFRKINTTTTIAKGDYSVYFDTSNGDINQNLPDGNYFNTNKTLKFGNSGTNVLTLLPSGVQTIDGYGSAVLYQYDSITITWDGSNWVS